MRTNQLMKERERERQDLERTREMEAQARDMIMKVQQHRHTAIVNSEKMPPCWPLLCLAPPLHLGVYYL